MDVDTSHAGPLTNSASAILTMAPSVVCLFDTPLILHMQTWMSILLQQTSHAGSLDSASAILARCARLHLLQSWDKGRFSRRFG